VSRREALVARRDVPGSARRPAPRARDPLREAVLLMQRSAGNRAVARRLLQRDVGFEYEVNRETYSAERMPTSTERRQSKGRPPWARKQSLGKGRTLVTDLGGVHLKTDLGGTWHDTNLEIEIDPVPETPEGRETLLERLRTVEVVAQLMDRQRAQGVYHMSVPRLAWSLRGAPTGDDLYIHMGSKETSGNPQVTAGIRLDQVAQLMERTVGGPTAGPHAVGVASLERIELGIGGSDFGVVGDAPRQVRAGIQAFLAERNNPPDTFPSAALVGLCSVMLTYLVRGGGDTLAYAKQIAPLMARTDFGHMFARYVPREERKYLRAQGGRRFRLMWRKILKKAGVAGGIDAPLYAASPSAALGSALPGALSRRAWLDGIVTGVDLLTSKHIPGVAAGDPLTDAQAWRLNQFQLGPAAPGQQATQQQAEALTSYRRDQLFGLGAMGGKHDMVNPAGGGMKAPIFELRRMRQNVDVHTFTEMALGVYDHIVALNATAPGATAPAYHQSRRAASQPSRGQRIRYAMVVGL
jgi:hypothetical protein